MTPIAASGGEIDVRVNVPGFRTESLVVVTSLLDDKSDTHDEISKLYLARSVMRPLSGAASAQWHLLY